MFIIFEKKSDWQSCLTSKIYTGNNENLKWSNQLILKRGQRNLTFAYDPDISPPKF